MTVRPRLALISAIFLGCAVFTASPALAQTRSSIAGTIVDQSGAVLPGVTVVLESPDLVGGTHGRQAV